MVSTQTYFGAGTPPPEPCREPFRACPQDPVRTPLPRITRPPLSPGYRDPLRFEALRYHVAPARGRYREPASGFVRGRHRRKRKLRAPAYEPVLRVLLNL